MLLETASNAEEKKMLGMSVSIALDLLLFYRLLVIVNGSFLG